MSDPSEIRDTVVRLADALNYEETLLELIRFLPTSTLSDFVDHLREVADVEDLI